MAKYCCWMLLVGTLCFPITAAATTPSEELLPSTTKGYVSVPNVEALRAKWNETQLGQLVNDPVMKPSAMPLVAPLLACPRRKPKLPPSARASSRSVS